MNVPLARRRALRRNSTDAETALWFHLRGKRFAGFKFRRQHPCGPYILDFYCPSRHLAVELDGGQHFDPIAQAYDARRSGYLERFGIRVLRFTNDLVFRELAAVLEAIDVGLRADPSPSSPLPARAGRGYRIGRTPLPSPGPAKRGQGTGSDGPGPGGTGWELD